MYRSPDQNYRYYSMYTKKIFAMLSLDAFLKQSCVCQSLNRFRTSLVLFQTKSLNQDESVSSSFTVKAEAMNLFQLLRDLEYPGTVMIQKPDNRIPETLEKWTFWQSGTLMVEAKWLRWPFKNLTFQMFWPSFLLGSYTPIILLSPLVEHSQSQLT